MRLPARDQGQTNRCPQCPANPADESAGDRLGRYRAAARRPQPLSGGRVADARHRARFDPDAGPLSGLCTVRKRSLPTLEITSLKATGALADAKIAGTD